MQNSTNAQKHNARSQDRRVAEAHKARLRHLPLVLILVLLTCLLSPPVQAQAPRAEQIAVSAYRNGQWDIYTVSPDGQTIRQLTNDPFEETDPAFSPDGTQLAFASRRDDNWDIYRLDLQSGNLTRLTTHPDYDGAPAWRPDSEALAFESYRAGSLDIWQVGLDVDESPVNLTPDSTEFGDFGPAYSPNGQTLAFSSWREEQKDLYLLDVQNGDVTRLTSSPAAEEWPAWNPEGGTLTFVEDNLGDREVFTLNLADLDVISPVTWLGRTDGPVYSPDGQRIAAIFHRWDGDQLILTTPGPGGSHQLPVELTPVVNLQGRLSWHPQAIESGLKVGTLADAGTLLAYEEQITRNEDPEAEPYSLVRQNDIETGTPWLADTVDDSFQAWRRKLRNEVGYDFLQTLSDASRDVAAFTETSQYASWHKSGRAVDTLFDYHLSDQLAHEIGREDYSGETYWRIYLRCTDQSGGCGRPLSAHPWNYSERARALIAPEQGGIEKAIPAGYYVDMTALARQHGWERISSYDDEEYSWTWHFIAFEYWHYQKRFEQDGAANWYQAMQDVYPEATLQKYFNWQKMRQLDDDPHLIALKGVPLPLEYRPWWSLVQP